MTTIAADRQQLLADLDGLVSEEAGLRLAVLAATVPAGQAIVEIGSFRGKSTCYLAEGARLGGAAGVWAIDAWDLPGNTPGRYRFDRAREQFDEQVDRLGFDSFIVPVTAFSTSAARVWKQSTHDRSIGMLFIDGSHLYADVRADVEAWLPLVESGGIVVFDDYRTPKNPGVEKVVDELALEEWDFSTPNLAIGRKP